MPRWSAKEVDCMRQVRERLADLIAAAPPFPEVVGDRKIIRFLRGHDYNVDKVCDLYGKFLRWRKEANVDEVRTNIVERGMDHPLKFPKGDLILSLMPTLVIDPTACDIHGSPLVVDQYKFAPNDVMSKMTMADYITYLTYTLEYRSLILEQLSEEREFAYLASLGSFERQQIEDDPSISYGMLVMTCVIRDLAGVGFEHLGAKGQEIAKAVISLASDNYPELMRKTYMINSPWIFQTTWFLIKGWLAPRTVQKISILGSNYLEEIYKEISKDILPRMIGGEYEGYCAYIAFPFNLRYFCNSNNNNKDSSIKHKDSGLLELSNVGDSLPPIVDPPEKEASKESNSSLTTTVSTASSTIASPPLPPLPPVSQVSHKKNDDDDLNSNMTSPTATNGGYSPINVLSMQTAGY